MRRGISLVALVITIVVLVILTGTVIITTMNNNIFGTAQDTVNEYNKKVIIEDINTKIQAEKIKKAQQGIYSMKMIDIIPIIETYGTFDNKILKLKTTQGIEIWLYEIMPIPLGEYAIITYENNILTIQTELTNNGYRVQYSIDAGSNWNLYTNPTNIAQESGIQIRLINGEGVVVSNVLKITGGVIGEVDNTNPTITITASKESIYLGESVTYIITFSEYITDFTLEDITVTNGTKHDLSESEGNYVLTVSNAIVGTQTVNILANVCTDNMGNGNTANSKSITVKPITTLAQLGLTVSDYGKTVSGYSANGIDDWKLFYKQTINDEEYVYIIASNVLTNSQIPTIMGATKGTHTNGYGTLYWNSVPEVEAVETAQRYFMANWSNYSMYNNGKAVSVILNTNNWDQFIDTSYSRYIIGAIGSPTLEMWRESYNAKVYTTNIPTLTISTYGYKNTISGLQISDELYFPRYNNKETNYLFASPSEIRYPNCGATELIWGTHSYNECTHKNSTNSSTKYNCSYCGLTVSSYRTTVLKCPICGNNGIGKEYYYLSHSCSSEGETGIVYVNSNGNIKYDTNIYSFCGIRPIICINSNVLAIRSGDIIMLKN